MTPADAARNDGCSSSSPASCARIDKRCARFSQADGLHACMHGRRALIRARAAARFLVSPRLRTSAETTQYLADTLARRVCRDGCWYDSIDNRRSYTAVTGRPHNQANWWCRSQDDDVLHFDHGVRVWHVLHPATSCRAGGAGEHSVAATQLRAEAAEAGATRPEPARPRLSFERPFAAAAAPPLPLAAPAPRLAWTSLDGGGGATLSEVASSGWSATQQQQQQQRGADARLAQDRHATPDPDRR